MKWNKDKELETEILNNRDYYISDEDDDEFNYVLDTILNWCNYLEYCFQDWDFLSETINNLANCYVQNDGLEGINYLGIDTEYLIDVEGLMSDDLFYKFKEYVEVQKK